MRRLCTTRPRSDRGVSVPGGLAPRGGSEGVLATITTKAKEQALGFRCSRIDMNDCRRFRVRQNSDRNVV